MKYCIPCYLFVIVFLFVSQTAVSQRKLTYTFDTSIHFARPAAFSHLKVVDNREHKEDIGYVRTGGFDRKAILVTDKAFDEALSDFSAGIFRSSKQTTDTLLLVLYDFRMEDKPNDDELGTFYFRGQFFSGAGNGRYYLRKAIDTIFEVKFGAVDITSAVKRMGSEKFAEWLIVLGSGPGVIPATTYSFSEAASIVKQEKMRYPIYATAGNFRKGVYISYEDFLNNNPVDTPFVQVDHYIENKVNKPLFYYQNSRGKKGAAIDSVFAIYNGQNWYQPRKSGWSRLRYEDGDFFKKQEFLGIWNPSELTSAFGIFGLAGGLAAGIVEDASSRTRAMGIYDSRLDPSARRFYPVRRIY